VLTGSGLGQQNASTRRCCSPIRSFIPTGVVVLSLWDHLRQDEL
jgi:hypothetical protein